MRTNPGHGRKRQSNAFRSNPSAPSFSLELTSSRSKDPRKERTPLADPIVALEAAQSQPPDLLITDVLMPQLNGSKLAIRINSGNRIIAGHGRAEAARILGMTEVPTIRIGYSTPRPVHNTAGQRSQRTAQWHDSHMPDQQMRRLEVRTMEFQHAHAGQPTQHTRDQARGYSI